MTKECSLVLVQCCCIKQLLQWHFKSLQASTNHLPCSRVSELDISQHGYGSLSTCVSTVIIGFDITSFAQQCLRCWNHSSVLEISSAYLHRHWYQNMQGCASAKSSWAAVKTVNCVSILGDQHTIHALVGDFNAPVYYVRDDADF